MARASKNKEAAVGSQNRTVSPNEAKSALTHCIKLKRPIMMWGAPGIGKSDIVKQIADSGHTLMAEDPNKVLDYLIEVL